MSMLVHHCFNCKELLTESSTSKHGYKAPVVHGLQVLAFTAPGATMFPHDIGKAFIAFTESSCKFLKEVNACYTLYPALEIIALNLQGNAGIVETAATIHNQNGELVLSVQSRLIR